MFPKWERLLTTEKKYPPRGATGQRLGSVLPQNLVVKAAHCFKKTTFEVGRDPSSAGAALPGAAGLTKNAGLPTRGR
jgi:hypothetical protein